MQDSLGHPGIFTILLLLAVFYPAQGFFNFGVFVWPKYQKTRRAATLRLRQIVVERRSTHVRTQSNDIDGDSAINTDADNANAQNNGSSSVPAHPQSHMTDEEERGGLETDAPVLNPLQVLYWTINAVDSSRMTFSRQSLNSIFLEFERNQQSALTRPRSSDSRDRKPFITDTSADGNRACTQNSQQEVETGTAPTETDPTIAADGEDADANEGGTTRSGRNEGVQVNGTSRQPPARTEPIPRSNHKTIDHAGIVK